MAIAMEVPGIIEARSKRQPSLLQKAGGLILGLLAEPTGRHSVNHFRSSEKPKNIFKRTLGRLAGITEPSNRAGMGGARQVKPESTEPRLAGWREITPEEYLGVDRNQLSDRIDRLNDYGTLETLAWKLDRLADNNDTNPATQAQFDALSDRVYDKMVAQDPYTGVDTSRYWRQVARSQRSAQSDTHPTRQMKLPPYDN